MYRIVIIGLGPGRSRHLTFEAGRALLAARPLYLRTGRHPMARWLKRRGCRFSTFDPLCDRARDISQVDRAVARRLIRASLCCGTVYYAVPGNPMAGEAAVGILRRMA